MTSLSDKSLERERRRRRGTARRTQTPWLLYVVAWVVVAVLMADAAHTGAAWPRWSIGAVVVALVAWLLWDLWRERR
jgi:Flp pilus assembly protein TadB